MRRDTHSLHKAWLRRPRNPSPVHESIHCHGRFEQPHPSGDLPRDVRPSGTAARMPRTDGDRWMTSPDVRRLTPTGIDLSRSSRASRTSDGCHAHAGINRRQFRPSAVRAAPPRTRGDRPPHRPTTTDRRDATPHALSIMGEGHYPARAGCEPPAVTPHARGSTPGIFTKRPRYPARAGIDRAGRYAVC